MPLQISRIRAICFDVDGTLSDSDDQWETRFSRLLSPFHFLFPRFTTANAARRLVMAIETPANFLMGIPDKLGLDSSLARLSAWINLTLGHHRRKEFLLINGVKEMLGILSQRYPLAVVSARDAWTTQAFLEQFDLLPFFRCVASAQTCVHTKPFPDPILWAAKQMNVQPEECLMVGDTRTDMRAGTAAGAQKVGVLCGFGERDELIKYGADLIINTTPDLVKVLE
jgi:HAD superfamily hydrolase (TIGR01509 family)